MAEEAGNVEQENLQQLPDQHPSQNDQEMLQDQSDAERPSEQPLEIDLSQHNEERLQNGPLVDKSLELPPEIDLAQYAECLQVMDDADNSLEPNHLSSDDKSDDTPADAAPGEPEDDDSIVQIDARLQLAFTIQMLHEETGNAILSGLPLSVIFEVVQSIATVACGRDESNSELSASVVQLLDCSSAGNILQRLEAWPACHLRLQQCAAGTEFHGLFAASMHELQKRAERREAVEGEYGLGQCDICCSEADSLLWRGGCCQTSVCVCCLHRWLIDHLTEVNTKLGCPGCSSVLTVPKLRHLLSESAMDRREQLLARQRGSNSNERDCPRCSCMAQRPRGQRRRRFRSDRAQRELGGVTVKCAQCDYVWCFDCHSPAHPGLSCSRFRSGVNMLEDWARQMEQSGVRKARRCPKCKAMIEKNEGCNHMTCAHCHHEFCYLCSKRWKVKQLRVPYLRWSVFGSHSNRLSVFGCRHEFMPDRPALRRFIRGTLFVLRVLGLILVPTVGVAILLPIAAALVAIAIPLAPVFVPVIIVFCCCRKRE